jgi:choline oxidase
MSTHYDYLIIGGGTAGAIVAARLAARRDLRVALIEAGPSDEHNPEVLHLRHWTKLLGGDLDYNYAIEPQPRGNSQIRHARARMLGGCSSHNACIAFVPPASDFTRWVAAGAEGWGAENVLPFFARLQEKVHLEQAQPVNACNRALVEAAQQAGFSLQRFNHEPLRAGVGWFDLNKRGELRHSSSVAYLHPLSQWGERLRIYTNTPVLRLLLDQTLSAIGVETASGPLYGDRELILCAGAFESPKLLMLSGIGPADHLRQMDIPVRIDRPGVGQHLLDHPECPVLYEAAQPVPPESTQGWEVGLFARVEPGGDEPDLMFHFGSELADLNTLPQGYPTARNGFSLVPNVMRPRGQGLLRLRAADPTAPPRLDFRYFNDPAGYDESILVTGIKLARVIVAQPALQSWVRRELAPGAGVQSETALSTYARQCANTVQHPAGTCKMGASTDPLAVVDARLRVYGVQRLRVADASIFPTLPGVNPNLTCMMVGERCADFLLQG